MMLSFIPLFLLELCALAEGIRVIRKTTLGADPQTVNRLNGESFQQDPITTLNGYQYAVLWASDSANASVRHASVARRALSASSDWETFRLTDYNQTDDDGHNVITMGVSRGDGTIHLAFDQHDNNLNYRVSRAGVASNPANTPWTSDIFAPAGTLDHLPGLETLNKSTYFSNVTYPRFLSVPPRNASDEADLFLELRVGRSGLGDDWIYLYTPQTGAWSQVGRYLEGVNNNAYINGLDFDAQGVLHVTWTYRDYVNDVGQNVAVEAGPNGPENNHDMNYAHSSDLGRTWRNNWGQRIASLDPAPTNVSAQMPANAIDISDADGGIPRTIVPASAGITMFGIPKYGGILNQEAQTVDDEGRVHVLNRENTTGTERWYHYWRSTSAHWTRTALPLTLDPPSVNNITQTPTVIGKRGKLVALPASATQTDTSTPATLLALLPSNALLGPSSDAFTNVSTALSILASTAAGHFRDWHVVWEVPRGCGAEPLFDRTRLQADGVLSVYLVNEGEVQVWDLDVSGV